MKDENTTTAPVNQIDLDNISDFEVLKGKPEAPSLEKPDAVTKDEEEEEKADQKPEVDKEGDSASEKDEESEESDEESSADDSSEESEEQGGDEIDLTEEQAHDIAAQVLGEPVEAIQKKLARLEELEKQTQEPKFPTEKHKKLYEFVSKYSGNDFESGVVQFARLASLDVEKLDAKDAMKELFIQENPKLSREKAEKLFEHDFEDQFGKIEDEDIAQTKIGLQGDKAKEKLMTLQKETHTAKADTDTKQYEEQRNNFLKSVEESINDFDQLELAIENDPGSKYNFEIENREDIREAMSDIATHFKKMEWVDDKGNYNFDKMKTDYAFLYNKEKMLESYFKHGKDVMKEEMLAEIGKKTTTKKSPDHPGNGSPKTAEDAFAEAVMNAPTPKNRR